MSRGDWTTSKLELRAEHGIRGAFYSRRWRRGRAANQGRESQPPAFPSLRFRGVGGVAARRRQTPRPDKKKETPAVCCHAGGRGISDIACPVGRTGGMSPSPTTERKDRGSSSDGTSRWNFLGAQDFFLKKEEIIPPSRGWYQRLGGWIPSGIGADVKSFVLPTDIT